MQLSTGRSPEPFDQIAIESWTQSADYETAASLIIILAVAQIAGNNHSLATGIAGAMSIPPVYAHGTSANAQSQRSNTANPLPQPESAALLHPTLILLLCNS